MLFFPCVPFLFRRDDRYDNGCADRIMWYRETNKKEGEIMTLSEWTESFKKRFEQRERDYMQVHKATILLQLKDKETGEIQMHELEYISREAENLLMLHGAKRESNPA